MMCRHYRCLLLAGRLGSEICCRNETTPRALSWDMVFDSQQSRTGATLGQGAIRPLKWEPCSDITTGSVSHLVVSDSLQIYRL